MEEYPSRNGTSNKETEIIRQGRNSLENLNIRSAEVQEIIGRPPHWLVRSGIAGLFGILILILLAASVIKYPEVIKAPIRLTAINAPKTLQSKVNGKLVKLFVKNNTYVKQGQILGWVESTASHQQVLILSEKIDSMRHWLENNRFQRIKAIDLSSFSALGSLQENFQAFEQAYRQFVSYLPGGYYDRRKNMLRRELKHKHLILNGLKTKKKILKEQYQLARQQYEMKKKLHQKKLIAPIKFIKQRNQLLNSRLPLQQAKSAITNNHAAQVVKKNQLLELQHKIDQQKTVFLQSLNLLQSAIDGWENKYLLVAPFAGEVIYANILQKNQSLKAGEDVFYIKPDNARFFGVMRVSQRSFGKIDKGQTVLVHFRGYPYQQFGSVHGKVSYLSAIPISDSAFVAKVRFPNGLTTDYGKRIQPENGMVGQAKIITKDRRLLERIYDNIAAQLK